MKIRTIALLVAAVLLAGLSVASAVASVRTAEDAIDAITAGGKVVYSEDSRTAIDAAVAAVDALDANLGLDGRVDNLADLQAAKIEYVRLAIKTADQANRRKLADGYTDEQIAQLVADARAALEAYLDEDQYDLVENYADLTALEAETAIDAQAFGAAQQAAVATAQESAAEVQLC